MPRIRRTLVVAGLTTMPRKVEAYGTDPYFRDGWEAVLKWAGTSRHARRFAWNHVPLLVRPDAIAAGRYDILLDRLESIGMHPIAAAEIPIDRRLIRELWRYQLNIATRDRIVLMDALLIGRPGLLILFSAPPSSGMPACVRLRSIKGPSHPASRNPTDLRAALSAARASVLTMVHTPDEPIDVFRDLAILLDARAIQDLLAAEPITPETVLTRLRELREQKVGAHDLSLERALRRLGLDELPRLTSAAAATIIDEVASMPTTASWDYLVVASHLARTHFKGFDPSIPDADPQDWER